MKGRYNQKESEGDTEEQPNALIINLQLSSGVQACASGKRIDAGNNIKRLEAWKKVQSVQEGGVAVFMQPVNKWRMLPLCSA